MVVVVMIRFSCVAGAVGVVVLVDNITTLPVVATGVVISARLTVKVVVDGVVVVTVVN